MKLAGWFAVVERDITYQIYAGDDPIETGYIEEAITVVKGKRGYVGGRKTPLKTPSRLERI